MKTEFAKEKSAYSIALHTFLDERMPIDVRNTAKQVMQGVEDVLKEEGDEIAIIITTVNTNPLKEKSAPPMEFYTPKDYTGPEPELIDACPNCHMAVIVCTCEAGT